MYKNSISQVWFHKWLVLCLLISTPSFAAKPKTDFLLQATGLVNDNMYLSTNPSGSISGAIVSPSIITTWSAKHSEIRLPLLASSGIFSAGNKDNYTDVSFKPKISWRPGRSQLSLQSGLVYGHDPFGTERTEGSGTSDRSLDRWRDIETIAEFINNLEYSNLLLFELNALHSKRKYVSNEENTSRLDRDRNELSAKLGFNFTAKTSIFLEAAYNDVDFINITQNAPNNSGDTISGLLGFRWKATTNTSGEIRIGQATRTADQGGSEFESSTWRAKLQWTPNRKTILQLQSGRHYLPSYRANAFFIDNKNYSGSWRQQWSQNFATTFSSAYTEKQFVGTNEIDEYFSGNLRLDYEMDNNFGLYALFNLLDRSSTIAALEADQTQASIGINVKLN